MAGPDEKPGDDREREVRDPFDAPDPPPFAPPGDGGMEMRHRPPGGPGGPQELPEAPEISELQEIAERPQEINELPEVNEIPPPEIGEIKETQEIIEIAPPEIFEVPENHEVFEVPESPNEVFEVVGPNEIFEIAEIPQPFDRSRIARLVAQLRDRFDRAGGVRFDDLPRRVRGAIVQLALRRGEELEKHAPRFIDAVKGKRFKEAAQAARDLGPGPGGKHPIAEHLERGIESGELPGG